jgi:hypothetical protein
VPPFTGVAVNVTFVPWQIAPCGFAVIDTLAGEPLTFTTTVSAFVHVARVFVIKARKVVVVLSTPLETE